VSDLDVGVVCSLHCIRLDEDEIEQRTDALREKLKDEQHGKDAKSARGLKAHQVHDLAEAKIDETEKIRKALGISKDYKEGGHWRRQEERKAENGARKTDGQNEK